MRFPCMRGVLESFLQIQAVSQKMSHIPFGASGLFES